MAKYLVGEPVGDRLVAAEQNLALAASVAGLAEVADTLAEAANNLAAVEEILAAIVGFLAGAGADIVAGIPLAMERKVRHKDYLPAQVAAVLWRQQYATG